MLGYVLRRLLLAPLTLLLILLVVFAVVNAVPAVPADSGADGGGLDDPRRAYQVFKEQYDLDLPVFLNLRHRIPAEEIRREVTEVVGADDTRSVRARETLADLGRVAIPALASLAADEAAPLEERDQALRMLPDLAIRWVRSSDSDAARAERREDNRAAEALRVRGPSIDPNDRARLATSWLAYVAARDGEFAPDGATLRRRMFCDTRFAKYLTRLARLDFGDSMVDKAPVLPTIFRRLRYSLFLSVISIVLAYGLAIPLGALSARIRGSRVDRALSLFLFALYSLPTYFAASLLIRLLCDSRALRWFPGSGFRSVRGYEDLTGLEQVLDVSHHLVLPVFCLTYGSLAVLSRFARASMIEVLQSDFIRTARANGAGEARVLFRHGLRNALLPVATLIGDVLPAVFSGAVIVEVLFDIPGTGTFLYQSIDGRDYNAVLATTLIASVLTLIGYLISDLLYAVVDPRIRLQSRSTK